MSAPRLVIIADDLTGAADSAARAAPAGRPAAIFPARPRRPADAAAPAQAVAVSTDSRFLPPQEAAGRVTDVAGRLAAWRGATWYKKIDSTLRGNLGAELAALLTALGPQSRAAICPAFPAQGRGLADGYLVHSATPPRSVYLPGRIAEQTDLPVASIGLAVVRRGVTAVANAITAAGDARLLVMDALVDDDLATMVAVAGQLGLALCGSAGMVAPLAARLADEPAASVPTAHMEGPLLAVVGSGSATAHAQVRAVAEDGCMRVREVGSGWRALDLLGASGHPQGDWLVHLPIPLPETPLEGPAARREAARLADLIVASVAQLEPGALLLVGGDTAAYVLRGLGIARLDVTHELLPGIPLTEGTDDRGVRRCVVLKPGNFGDKQVLVTLRTLLRAMQPSEQIATR